MTFDYAKTADTSLRLLTRFGQNVSLVVATTGAYDPAAGAAPVTEKKETRKAVLLDFDRINFGVTLQDGSRVMANDRRCLMDAKGSAPRIHDFVEVAGERFPIADIKTLSPAGTPILYDMLIRK